MRLPLVIPDRNARPFDVVTVGLTWYLNRWFKVQGNAIHESFDDPARAPIEGRGAYWSYVGRLQFAL